MRAAFELSLAGPRRIVLGSALMASIGARLDCAKPANKSPAAGVSRRGKFMLTKDENEPESARNQGPKTEEALRLMRFFGQEDRAATGRLLGAIQERHPCVLPS